MLCLRKKNNQQGDVMDINITKSSTNHAKSIIQEQRTSKELAFKDIISPTLLKRHLTDLPCRERIFTPAVTLHSLLSQVISSDQTCQAAVVQVIAKFAEGDCNISANTAAYCKARSRLPEKVLSGLARDCARELDEETSNEWLWRDRHVRLVDGSCVSMPDTIENQAMYPQPTTQEDGLGFPIARFVGVISMATGAVLDFAMGSYSGKGTGEHALLRNIISVFNRGDIMLGDCYYPSFFLIAELQQRGVEAVFPAHAARHCDFRRGTHLGKKDHIAKWKKPKRPTWMDKETYKNYPEAITIRETQISQNRPGFRTKSRIIVTTFLEPDDVSKDDLAKLYDYRWFVEIDFLAIKQTMKMDILRCKSPEMVRKEIWAHLLAYNLIRKVMSQAARAYNKNPRQLSFKLSMQVIFAFCQAGLFNESNQKIYEKILKAIAYKKVGNRSGRSEPRRVKRRPKSFPRLNKPRKDFHKKGA
jgi:hypothetical protein